MTTPATTSAWTMRRLTDEREWTGGIAHSYYDLPVFDAAGERILAHRLPFVGRHPTAEDAVQVGAVDARTGAWTRFGESRAWSWQQGPMAQWVAGGPQAIWNDREDGRIVSRLLDADTGRTRTLPGQCYAVTPDGRTALSIDLTRLDRLRPGYGYPGGGTGTLAKVTDADGVWAIDTTAGDRRLLLPLARAVAFLDAHRALPDRLSRRLRGVHYWFNHAKIAPSGSRFTVKLRWRRLGGPWNDTMGVSLTCGMDGAGLRLLAPATSHVIWRDDDHLYFWHDGALRLARDDAPVGAILHDLADGVVTDNVHIRHLDAQATRYVVDTPYRETVDLFEWDAGTGATEPIARFTGHAPARGPFRCDLHPNPSPDGRRVVVTSLMGGRRNLHLAERRA